MAQDEAVAGQSIGFIGLGAMGLPMASRMADAGRRVIVYDIAPSQAARQYSGFVWADSPLKVAAKAATIVLSLPNAKASAAVIGELSSTPSGCKLVIDTCTQDPDEARGFESRLRQAGVAYCDAPVFGTPHDAAAGSLTIAYSGAADLRGAIESVLAMISRRQTHVGPVGNASLFKVVQNSLGLVQLVAIAEAFAVVEKAGADPVKFYEVVKGSGGMADSPFFTKTGRDFADNEGRFGALLRVAIKDIELGRTVADRTGAEAKLVAAATTLFKRAGKLGLGDADLTCIGQALGRAADA